MSLPTLIVLAIIGIGLLLQGAAAHLEDERSRTGMLWAIAIIGGCAIAAVTGLAALDMFVETMPNQVGR